MWHFWHLAGAERCNIVSATLAAFRQRRLVRSILCLRLCKSATDCPELQNPSHLGEQICGLKLDITCLSIIYIGRCGGIRKTSPSAHCRLSPSTGAKWNRAGRTGKLNGRSMPVRYVPGPYLQKGVPFPPFIRIAFAFVFSSDLYCAVCSSQGRKNAVAEMVHWLYVAPVSHNNLSRVCNP